MANDSELIAGLNRHLNDMAGRPPVDWQNSSYTQTGALYYSQRLIPAEPVEVGRAQGDDEMLAGIYQITINAPKGLGDTVTRAELARIKARFVARSTLVEGGTRIVISKVWANPPISDESYQRTPVSIRYRAA